MFKFEFENLGAIDNAQVTLNQLTVFCGGNNTGKTYVSYAIYEMLKTLKHFIADLNSLEEEMGSGDTALVFDLEDIVSIIDEVTEKGSEKFSSNLYKLFSTNKSFFIGSKVKLNLDKQQFKEYLLDLAAGYLIMSSNDITIEIDKNPGDMKVNISYALSESDLNKELSVDINFIYEIIEKELSEMIFEGLVRSVFLLPAERSGLNLFYSELNEKRNEFVHNLRVNILDKKSNKNLINQITDNINAYSKPISDYISFLNSKKKLSMEESEFSDLAKELMEQVLKGTYKVIDQDIFFVPLNESKKLINLHIASSTAKSLYGLVFYLNYMASKGQFLIIDEPELNLHPDNQRKLARILAEASNRGIKIILTTHSDYIIKEFNNLIMLSNNFPSGKVLREKYGYKKEQLMKKENVTAYVFNDGILEMEIDDKEGIIADTFDDVINSYNKAADDIFYTMQEELDVE